MSREVVNDVANLVKHNHCIEWLLLGNNNLQLSAIVFIQAFKRFSNLTVLDLMGNNLSEKVIDDLINTIKCNSQLKMLSLIHNLHQSTVAILKALSELSSLKEL